MDIDVIVFTMLAPVWHIQGHTLHPYIMVDAAVPWFDPIPPIGHQATQKGVNKTMWMMTKRALWQRWMSLLPSTMMLHHW
jgi:hypothetical protein